MKAGYFFAWVDGENDPLMAFHFQMDDKHPGDLPVFSLGRRETWRPGALAMLPLPPDPFALDLSSIEIADAGLKEVAALANVQMLVVNGTEVTANGLEHLTRDCQPSAFR